MTETRKIAAILAADVVGYSRLAGTDEDRTLARLRALRSDLIDPTIAMHNGRVVKRTGDGAIVEFRSAVEAVHCAIEVQNGMIERNAGLQPERCIEFRIGIHVGDVVEECDGDLMGNSVNVAARLEGVATPGGICLSEDAYRQVKARIKLPVSDLGPTKLKNIAEPVRVYSLSVAAASQEGNETRRSEKPIIPLTLPDKPSIAVLPFQNMSGSSDQDYFADGIVEDITTSLARIPWLFVIARNSSFTYKGRAVDLKQVGRELGVRYVLEGSVRSTGNRVRVTGQLIEAVTGAHIWAERFDGDLEDIFDLQDQITSRVVGALAPKLEQAEIEHAKRKPTESLNAYDCYMRGMAGFHRGSRAALKEALQYFERAIKLDPGFASAYGMAAWCCVIRNNNGWLSEAEIDRMTWLARQGTRVGKDDPIALSIGGIVLAQVLADTLGAATLLDRALLVGPNLAAVWHLSGWIRLYLGQPRLAIEHMERALRLNPLDPLQYGAQTGLAAAHFLAGQYEDAASWAEKALREQPNYTAALRMGAASYALAGQIDKARSYVARVLKIDPVLRVSNLKGIVPFRGSADAARYIDGLRQAGLPE